MSVKKKVIGSRSRYSKRRLMLTWRSLNSSLSAETAQPCKDVGQQDPVRTELEAELKRHAEAILRQKADFENFRKRMMKEKDQAGDFAQEDLLGKLLPVVDNFDRALAVTNSGASSQALLDGVQMIATQLSRILQSAGLEKIEAMGKNFDPNEHEALATEERADVQENCVCQEMQSGYRFKQKVIRPAMVKVARSPAPETAGEVS